MQLPPRRALATLFALLALPALSAAAPTRIRLDASPPPPECPDLSALEAHVVAQLGRDPFEPDAARVFSVRWRREDGALVADLAVREGEAVRGRRRLTSRADECAALHRAVGLMLAIALDPLRLGEPLPAGVIEATEAAPPADAPPDPTVADAEPTPPAEAVASVEPPPPHPPMVMTRALGLRAAWGVAPTAGLGARGDVHWRGSRFALGLGLLGVVGLGSDFAGGRVDAALLAADLFAGLRLGAVELSAIATGGWLPAWGSGFDRDARSDSPFVAVGLRAGWAFALADGLALRPTVEILRPVVGARLLVGDETAWRTPALTAGGGLDLLF